MLLVILLPKTHPPAQTILDQLRPLNTPLVNRKNLLLNSSKLGTVGNFVGVNELKFSSLEKLVVKILGNSSYKKIKFIYYTFFFFCFIFNLLI